MIAQLTVLCLNYAEALFMSKYCLVHLFDLFTRKFIHFVIFFTFAVGIQDDGSVCLSYDSAEL